MTPPLKAMNNEKQQHFFFISKLSKESSAAAAIVATPAFGRFQQQLPGPPAIVDVSAERQSLSRYAESDLHWH